MTIHNFLISEATSDDIPSLADLHKVTFEGSIGVTLGERYISNFIKWFVLNPKAIVLVVRKDKTIVGYTFGAPTGYTTGMNRALFSTILLALLTHPWVIMDLRFFRQIPSRLKSFFNFMNPFTPVVVPTNSTSNVYRLTAIGISPHLRTYGLGKMLIAAYEQSVRNLGFKQVQLSVYRENYKAIRLYLSCGWNPISSNGRIITFAKQLTA